MEENENCVVYQGWLEKRSRYLQTWRKRYAILLKTHLVTYESEDTGNIPTENILLRNCKGIKSTHEEIKQELSFKIMFEEQSFYFKAFSNEDYQNWLKNITKALVHKKLKILKPLYTSGESSEEEDNIGK
jgi:hypothetical protein